MIVFGDKSVVGLAGNDAGDTPVVRQRRWSEKRRVFRSHRAETTGNSSSPALSYYWAVNIDGKRYNLGTDEREAKRFFHELMAKGVAAKPVVAPSGSAAAAFDAFLAWTKRERALRTDLYRDVAFPSPKPRPC